jgi:hypothetical protein
VITNVNLQALISSELAPQIDRFVKRADSNSDGRVSTDEVSQFLSELLRKLEHTGEPAAPASESPAGVR